jgi:hypothetical protein
MGAVNDFVVWWVTRPFRLRAKAADGGPPVLRRCDIYCELEFLTEAEVLKILRGEEGNFNYED